MNKRIHNSLFLSAIGDALGWITEFERSKEDLYKRYGVSEIIEFRDWQKPVGGRFNGYVDYIKAGSYSDDTQLILSVCRSLNLDGSMDHHYFAKTELPTWLHYARGAGRTIKNAARKIERKSADWNNNFFSYKAGKTTLQYADSGANGAAMRILPIALANSERENQLLNEIFYNSISTHGHPRAIVGAMLYGLAVSDLHKQNHEDFDSLNFLTGFGKTISDRLSLSNIDQKPIRDWMLTWDKEAGRSFADEYAQTVMEVVVHLRQVFMGLRDQEDDTLVLRKLGCFAPETKGSGIATVVGGLFLALKYPKEPKQGILVAVNAIGTDTDSVAAFTGGLLGALHDDEVIPEQWCGVQDADYLRNMADKIEKIQSGKYVLIRSNEKVDLMRASLELPIKNDEYAIGDEVYFDPLGLGIIQKVDRQTPLTQGKFNLILDVDFENGQSCKFAKLLNHPE
ncbi:ADP-ribosylglycohydrolase family protein [Robertkochia sediminum]|uniref:ADP-ribosylglycohydrolase family protein n=1 Tax=Robertkochia sediminum TaxID=2785326 RepID=UPI001932D483|nr:ADP-ribosylglycohydrolase family protein [Robertkochia sediminum]MBL7471381.1 ADP-ribosylglycohydrolase family protein [Robertkochia sediminum]